MAPYSVLSIGSHPNIAFYNWRLNSSNSVHLSCIASTAIIETQSATIQNPKPTTYSWSSTQFGNERFTINNVYQTIDDYINLKFSSTSSSAFQNLDFIFLSATSLQELSTICSTLSSILKLQLANHNVPTIIIESTNFVNLEPFVKMSLQLDDQIPIISIMSDFDIREVGNNNYLVYKSKKESELLYVGKSGNENNYTSQEIGLINKIADLFESVKIDVYKLNTPLEFLSYQWKFALPKITVEPLSIIFEKPFPNDLQNQILAKPLISGLIFEIITVIKTMGCKLFNSYDNEVSLLERLSQLYPSVDLSQDVSEAPKLYYDFFNQNQLYLDLLLLQPILIADDYQVKTPYLEFLYAIMSQYNTNNYSTLNNPTSIFWLRKNSENIRQLKLQQDEIALQNSYREREIKKSESLLLNSNPNSNSNLNHMNQSSANKRNNYPPPKQQLYQQYRQSTDPPIDPEVEEMSDMINTFGISDKTPPNQPREFTNGNVNIAPKTPNGYNQTQNNLQPGFTNNNNNNNNNNNLPGTSSPNFMPQQNLPHGLPPQGLPPHQPIFNSSPPQQQQQQHMHHQQMQVPPSRSSNRPGYYPPGGNGNAYSHMQSRDDVSYMSRASHMNGMNNNTSNNANNFDNSFNSLNGGGIPGMPGGLPGINTMPGMGPGGMGGPNRPFKPTSRKSSRKSVAALSSMTGGYGNPGMAGGNGGMPTRHSMMPPSRNGNMNNMKRQTQSMNTNMNINTNTSMNASMNTSMNAGMNAGINGGGMDNSSLAPPNLSASNGNNSDGGLSNGSSSSLPAATKNELVPVPEATPAPTPAYVPNPDKKEDKKKKRGFLGLGKKNKEKN